MKLGGNQTHIKIPLSQIDDSENVRKTYDEEEIKQLARSIMNDGLLNPLTVRTGKEDEFGIKHYELIAGHRRLRALKYLCDCGNDFSMVECCIRTGDLWTLQMVENVQRTDLSQQEKEEAVYQMLNKGLSQSEIADRISKPLSFVSDIIAGSKVRKDAEAQGIDTASISTKALSQLRSVPKEDLSQVVEKLTEKGGSVRAATEVLHDYKEEDVRKNSLFDADSADSYATDEKPTNAFEIEYEVSDEKPTTFVSSARTCAERDRAEYRTEEKSEETEHEQPKKEKKPESFNWYFKNSSAMEAAFGALPKIMKSMPRTTKLRVEVPGRIVEVTSIVYNPATDTLTFRGFGSEIG